MLFGLWNASPGDTEARGQGPSSKSRSVIWTEQSMDNLEQMVKVQLDLTDQMELDHKLEIVCERKQHGIENTE